VVEEKEKEGRAPEDLEELFVKLQEVVTAIVSRLDVESPKGKHPFVYGLQIKVSSDGEPHIQEFGDILPAPDRIMAGKREPLTEMSEKDGEICVTLEIPGVQEEQIEVEAKETKLIISVDSGDISYYKEIETDTEVDPKSISMTYVNGVLDITARKDERSRNAESEREDDGGVSA